MAHGPVPADLCVLHSCDNPLCCKPAHLFLGTRRDNSDDMRAKGRAAAPPRFPGAANPRALLTEQQVREIRRRYRPHIITAPQLASEYGVSKHAIYAAVARRSWKSVPA
jgi:hypothetical protein